MPSYMYLVAWQVVTSWNYPDYTIEINFTDL